jgi:phosphatidylinositol glycan class S
MLALLYFPAEHKYAVYTPLFAPVAVPLLVTLLKEVSAWRKARKLRKGGNAT